MTDTVTVVDYLKREITVGAEVYVVDTFDPERPHEPPAFGTVEAITDFEVEDEYEIAPPQGLPGSAVLRKMSLPKVRVRFSADEVVEFNTSGWRHDPNFYGVVGPEAPSSFDSLGMCEDLLVVEHNEE